jgi:hypothetical protein
LYPTSQKQISRAGTHVPLDGLKRIFAFLIRLELTRGAIVFAANFPQVLNRRARLFRNHKERKAASTLALLFRDLCVRPCLRGTVGRYFAHQ